MKSIRFLILTLIAAALGVPAFADFASTRAQENAASEQPVALPGGVTFSVHQAHDDAFRAAVTALQRGGYTLASASIDAGSIFTAIVVTGGWHQTGTRVFVTVIADSQKTTLIRVTVSEQKRFKALSTDPWGEPSLNESKSAAIAAALQGALSR